jgi:hypothetical protein
MTRVVVCGCAGGLPLAGVGLHYLQYCLGLRDLGCEVFYLEETGSWAYHPDEDRPDDEGRYAVPWLAEMFGRFDLPWAYRDGRGRYHNATEAEVHALCSAADVLLNVSGSHEPTRHHRYARSLVYIDTDPGFVQVKAATDASTRRWLERHDLLFTFAEAMGSSTCRIPDVGLKWQRTRQPVWLPFWAEVDRAPGTAYTTVMNWRAYDPVVWQGEEWGQKDAEFHVVRALPALTGLALELALGGSDPPRAELEAEGWLLAEPLAATRDIWTFRDYIAGSRGELTVAKQCYVRSGSGWFSERSANYLAAGRPVIAQDTGWSSVLPASRGAVCFSTTEEAAAALAVVDADPVGRSRAARELAASYFGSDLVLNQLLSDIGVE